MNPLLKTNTREKTNNGIQFSSSFSNNDGDIIPTVKSNQRLDNKAMIHTNRQQANNDMIRTNKQCSSSSSFSNNDGDIVPTVKSNQPMGNNEMIRTNIPLQTTGMSKFECVYCKLKHKFSPYNVSKEKSLKICDNIPMMIVDEKSGHYVVCIFTLAVEQKYVMLKLEDIKQVIDNEKSINDYAILFSGGIDILGDNGMILLLVNYPKKIGILTIKTLMQLIFCPKWWETFLISVASTIVNGDTINDCLDRVTKYRNMINKIAEKQNPNTTLLISGYNFPLLVAKIRTLSYTQKQINETKLTNIYKNEKKQEDEEKQKNLEILKITTQEQFQKELDKKTIVPLTYRENFILSLGNRNGKSHDMIAIINPEQHVFAKMIQGTGEKSVLKQCVNNNDEEKKAKLWDYYLNQQTDLDKGIKYKDYSKGKSKIFSLEIPTIPLDKKNTLQPLLTLSTTQKIQYAKIWEKFNSTELKTESKTNVFILDEWQQKTITAISNNKSCLIIGPTSGGKTYVMMHALENIINGIIKQNVVYVSPTFHLAFQTFANSKITFPDRKIALITAELIIIPNKSNIFIGTAPELLSYFVSSGNTFQVGIFDEIHVASSKYFDNSTKSDLIRAKSYSRLIAKCENQLIAASATIGGDEELIKYIINQMNVCRDVGKEMLFDDILHIKYHTRTVPQNEYRWVDNTSLQQLSRNPLTGVEQIVYPDTKNNFIDSPDNLFKLLVEMRKKDMTPAIIFNLSDDIAWRTYITLIKFLEINESRDYKMYTDIIEKMNITIDEFNEKRTTQMDSLPDLDKIKFNENKETTKISKRESSLRSIRNLRMKSIKHIIENATASFIRSVHQYNTEENNSLCDIPYELLTKASISRIANLLNISPPELLKIYPRIHISHAHNDIMTIIYNLKELEPDQTEIINNIETNKGSYYRFGKSCGIDQLRAIREPGDNDEKWKLRKNMISLAEAQCIDPSDIDGIIDVIMRGLEFGIAIIGSSLPIVIQNIVLDNLRTKNMGIIFASESMSMGINYPLRSVVIKSNSKTITMNVGKILQMAGRCGRRGKDTQAHVIYWGIDNACEAHTAFIKPLIDYKIDFFISDNKNVDLTGSMIENHLELATNLGEIYGTYYFVDEHKKKVPLSNTKNFRSKYQSFESIETESKTSKIYDIFDDSLERKYCSDNQVIIQLHRSIYLTPSIKILAINIGYDEKEASEIAEMVTKIDNDIILGSYKEESFEKSRKINLIIHMLIELHNTYTNSNNENFLKFLVKLINILQVCEYRLIKLAN